MTKKICTSCNLTDTNMALIGKSANWVKKTKKSHPPKKYIPPIKDIISVIINLGQQYGNRYIYYYASESKIMLGNKFNNKMSPKEAYGNYQNMGIAKLNKYGKTTIYINNPVSYYVDEDDLIYPPHVHFRVSNKNRDRWNKKSYTISI